jgi:hypothetical protein
MDELLEELRGGARLCCEMRGIPAFCNTPRAPNEDLASGALTDPAGQYVAMQ